MKRLNYLCDAQFLPAFFFSFVPATSHAHSAVLRTVMFGAQCGFQISNYRVQMCFSSCESTNVCYQGLEARCSLAHLCELCTCAVGFPPPRGGHSFMHSLVFCRYTAALACICKPPSHYIGA